MSNKKRKDLVLTWPTLYLHIIRMYEIAVLAKDKYESICNYCKGFLVFHRTYLVIGMTNVSLLMVITDSTKFYLKE